MDREYRSGGFRPQNRYVPVQQGEEIDVTIEAVGEKGDGIAKKEGFVIFVPNTKQGEKCKIRITKVLSKVAFGEKVGAGSPSEASEEEAPEPIVEDSEEF